MGSGLYPSGLGPAAMAHLSSLASPQHTDVHFTQASLICTQEDPSQTKRALHSWLQKPFLTNQPDFPQLSSSLPDAHIQCRTICFLLHPTKLWVLQCICSISMG